MHVMTLGLIAAAATGPAEAQQAATTLQVDASFPEPFSNIIGLRELSDGRLIVSDRLEEAVRILDFETGLYDEIGAVGQGPGEYRMPGPLLPLPGDSSLLIDLGNMRMTVFGPNGEFGGSEPLIGPAGLLFIPRAADGRGRIYSDQLINIAGDEVQGDDSRIPVTRLDRATGIIDTLVMIEPPQTPSLRTVRREVGDESDDGGLSFSGLGGIPAFPAQDAWGVGPDGSIAIVRVGDYHLELVRPDGVRLGGPPVPYTPVPITQEDKEAFADRLASRAVAYMQTVDGSGPRSNRTMALPRPDLDDIVWPEAKPPFPVGGVTLTPEGEVWVRRYVAFGEPESFDVFDEEGRLIRRVNLPEGRQVAGFGRGTLYAVYIDEDDLQWLERYFRDS